MTDLEITKRCAEAIGIDKKFWPMRFSAPDMFGDESIFVTSIEKPTYNPLLDDAQAMALVKKLELRLQEPEALPSADRRWRVTCWLPTKSVAQNVDLNRAICECVAKLEETK